MKTRSNKHYSVPDENYSEQSEEDNLNMMTDFPGDDMDPGTDDDLPTDTLASDDRNLQMVFNISKQFQSIMNTQNMQNTQTLTTLIGQLNSLRQNNNIDNCCAGVDVPVPDWNSDMSFEAWKRNIDIWSKDNPMKESQKLSILIESLKKNIERHEIKDWVIQEVDEDYTFDKSKEGAIKHQTCVSRFRNCDAYEK